MGRPKLRQGEAAGKRRQRCASPAACGDPTTAHTHPARPDTPSVQRTASLEPDALQPLTLAVGERHDASLHNQAASILREGGVMEHACVCRGVAAQVGRPKLRQ